jgi:hypothetical protein
MLASSAGARELPSEADLRAAYCLPIVQYLTDVMRPLATDPVIKESEVHQDIVDIIAEHTEGLRRLRLYLLPRIRHLDSLGVATALERGEEDRDKLAQYDTTCKTKCKPLARKSASSERACRQQCNAESPLKTRLDACFDLRWLPF